VKDVLQIKKQKNPIILWRWFPPQNTIPRLRGTQTVRNTLHEPSQQVQPSFMLGSSMRIDIRTRGGPPVGVVQAGMAARTCRTQGDERGVQPHSYNPCGGCCTTSAQDYHHTPYAPVHTRSWQDLILTRWQGCLDSIQYHQVNQYTCGQWFDYLGSC